MACCDASGGFVYVDGAATRARPCERAPFAWILDGFPNCAFEGEDSEDVYREDESVCEQETLRPSAVNAIEQPPSAPENSDIAATGGSANANTHAQASTSQAKRDGE